MPHPNILDPAKTALVVVDVQEAIRSAIGDFALAASNVSRAVRCFSVLGVPVIVTEQYPQGLGRTAEEVSLMFPENVEVFEKTSFSAYGSGEFVNSLASHGVKQIVLCGFETHVCVSQTAHDLIENGYDVHLMTDCVASRFDPDKQAGLSKMFAAGVVPSSVEMALFELMRDSRHPSFKEIQGLIK
jgi:nicotinamidase-related amidase